MRDLDADGRTEIHLVAGRVALLLRAEAPTPAATSVEGTLLLLGESLSGGARLLALLLSRRGLLALLDVLGVLKVPPSARLWASGWGVGFRVGGEEVGNEEGVSAS